MEKDLAPIRNEYHKLALNGSEVDPNPIEQFKIWLNQALDARVEEPTAMILSTASERGQPSSRVVLLKGLENEAFVFFTSYLSNKGHELQNNPQAAMTFFWPELERQVNITGRVKRTSDEISDHYFVSRPRKSQLGAWASLQSKELPSRYTLIKKFLILKLKYVGKNIPRPSYWGGFQLTPSSIEFWQGRPHRLHDRIRYTKTNNNHWKIQRFSP